MNQIESDTQQIEYIEQYFNELRKFDKYITYEELEKKHELVA
jgi:hypothetical protein